MSRNGYTELDGYVADEIRAEIARVRGASVKGIAEKLGIRRATLSARVNGHAPFTPSLIGAVASELGTTATEIVSRAERAIQEAAQSEVSAALAAEGRQ